MLVCFMSPEPFINKVGGLYFLAMCQDEKSIYKRGFNKLFWRYCSDGFPDRRLLNENLILILKPQV